MQQAKAQPLSQRLIRNSAHSTTVTAYQQAIVVRTHTAKNSQMKDAVAAIEQGMSIRRASEIYHITRSTLHDHVTGKIKYGARPGRPPYLTIEEEEEFVSFLVECAKIGYPHTRKQAMALMQEIMNEKGITTTISEGWWERFKGRHPSITLRVAAPLSYARAIASDVEALDRYFDLLEETLKSNEIFNKPSRIYNCDETGMPLNPDSHKVIDKVGSKNPSYPTGCGKMQVTVLACTCATGHAIPPMVIFDRKTLNPELTNGEVPGTVYGLSSNGWMNRELFSGWFTKHFIPHASSSRPLLLLLDGHMSHYSPDMIKMAAAQKVILCALPPNTTHLLQPLDKGCFSPLKSYWKQVVQEFVAKNRRPVSRYDFSSLFAEAWYKGMSMKNVLSGFKVCGIYPFDRTVFHEPDEQKKYTSFVPESLPRNSGLKYIPLYSPVPSRRQQSITSNHHNTDDMDDCSSASEKNADLSHSHSESFLSHDDSSSPNQSICVMPIKRATSFSQLLVVPKHPSKVSSDKQICTGRVLTSIENIKLLEEKEERKRLVQQEKDEKKRLREEKKRLQVQEKEEKRKLLLQKKEEKGIQVKKRLQKERIEDDDIAEPELGVFIRSTCT